MTAPTSTIGSLTASGAPDPATITAEATRSMRLINRLPSGSVERRAAFAAHMRRFPPLVGR